MYFLKDFFVFIFLLIVFLLVLDFEKFGGLSAVIQALNSNRAEVRVIAAWLLGKACQINPNIQYQVLGQN